MLTIQVYEGTGVACPEEINRQAVVRRDHVLDVLRDFQTHLVTFRDRPSFAENCREVGLWEKCHWKNYTTTAKRLEELNGKDFDFIAQNVFVRHSLLSGNDYTESGDINLANHKSFVACWGDHSQIIQLTGSHATFGIVIPLTFENDEMWTALRGLEDYAILSDDMQSEVEQELKYEEWGQGGWREDFVQRLEQANVLDATDLANDELIYQIFCQFEQNNDPWVPAKGRLGFDIFDPDNLVASITPEIIADARKEMP